LILNSEDAGVPGGIDIYVNIALQPFAVYEDESDCSKVGVSEQHSLAPFIHGIDTVLHGGDGGHCCAFHCYAAAVN